MGSIIIQMQRYKYLRKYVKWNPLIIFGHAIFQKSSFWIQGLHQSYQVYNQAQVVLVSCHSCCINADYIQVGRDGYGTSYDSKSGQCE